MGPYRPPAGPNLNQNWLSSVAPTGPAPAGPPAQGAAPTGPSSGGYIGQPNPTGPNQASLWSNSGSQSAVPGQGGAWVGGMWDPRAGQSGSSPSPNQSQPWKPNSMPYRGPPGGGGLNPMSFFGQGMRQIAGAGQGIMRQLPIVGGKKGGGGGGGK
jgi:hypothetical protein